MSRNRWLAALACVTILGISACTPGTKPADTPGVGHSSISPTPIVEPSPTATVELIPTPTVEPSPTPTREPPIYFEEGMEYPFGFEILGPGEPPQALCVGIFPCSIVATYLNHAPYFSSPYGGTAFQFTDADSGEPFTLAVRSGYADRIHLVPETTYRLVAQGRWDWFAPSTSGLVIKEGDELVFFGMTDVKLDRRVSIDCLSPIRAERVRILADNYREGDHCRPRFTNTEIAFSQDGESVLLHQGQSATLGEYEIDLEIARITEYGPCMDVVAIGISFTISRHSPGGAALSTRTIGTTASGPLASSAAITFPDPALEWYIRRLLHKDSGPILASDLEQPTCFIKLYPPVVWSLEEIPNQGQITDLRGIEHCTNLTEVILSGDGVTDLAPLARLTNLTRLQVNRGKLADLSPLEGLVSLTHLQIDNNQVSDLSPLSSLANLQHLEAPGNKIVDLSPLSPLVHLRRLSFWGNQIADISPLSSLVDLTELSLDVNQIVDVSPLSALVKLTELSFYHNQITDISALSSLVNLTDLSLNKNQIADVSALSSLVNLYVLSLYDNQITDISALSSLVNLSVLWLGENQIEDISALTPLTQLLVVDLGHNKIDDISPLVKNTGLGEGDYVDLRGNPLRSDSFEADRQQLIARGVNVSPWP